MNSTRSQRIALVVLLTLGMLIRLRFVLAGFALARDLETYIRWGQVVQTRGLADAYRDSDVSYPPLLLYLFGGAVGIASGAQQGHAPTEGADSLASLLIQLPTVVADLRIAGLLAWVLWRRAPPAGLLAAGLYLFN